MKKILHIASYYLPHIGGIEQVAADIIESLSEYRHTVLCFNDKKETAIEEVNNIKIIRIQTARKIASQPISFKYKKELKKLLRNEKFDVIHFHFPNPFAAYCLLSQKFNAKLIVHWHTDIIKQKFLKLFFKGQTNKLLKKASVIVATSENYLHNSEFLPYFSNKCVVINCAISGQIRENPHINSEYVDVIRRQYPNKKTALFVGRHVYYKGISFLIDATKYISDNVQILIAGVGPLSQELKDLAKDNSKITFIGKIPSEHLKDYYAACDIFVFPSIEKSEAFGIALAEALYYGKPAVTFTITGSGVNFVSLSGVTGIECPNRDSKAYGEAITKLANDDTLREQLGKNAKERALELFTFDKFKKEINELYEKNSN